MWVDVIMVKTQRLLYLLVPGDFSPWFVVILLVLDRKFSN